MSSDIKPNEKADATSRTASGTPIVEIKSALKDIDRSLWDACANPPWDGNGHAAQKNTPNVSSEETSYNPFISWDFLNCLERSNSAVSETGWLPQHLVLRDGNGAVNGVMPCYLKSHSQGEYVFDHGWADAFEAAGGRYYPKLQASVPFTPATGRRLLVKPGPGRDEHRQHLAAGLSELTRRHKVSSAHLTFMTEAEARLLNDLGYLIRHDQQFHWQDNGFGTFDGFLDALASRKRKSIRKERKTALENGIHIEWITGSDITEDHWDHFFDFYQDTGSRKWGRPYLTRSFFSLVGEAMPDRILLIMAKRNGRYVGGALNFIGSDTLFGRYWGCCEDHPFLHFEVCYYQAIDFALANGLTRVEAGAQGAHKLARGYLPNTTYSAHYIANGGFHDAVEDYLKNERRHVTWEQMALADRAPFRKES